MREVHRQARNVPTTDWIYAGIRGPLRSPVARGLQAPLLAALGLFGFTAGISASEVQNAARLTPQTVNVLVISFDPILKSRPNLKLHQYMRWSDPWKLTDKMLEDARVCSGGYVDYRVVEKLDYDWWQYIVNYDEAVQKLAPPGATFEKAKAAMYAK